MFWVGVVVGVLIGSMATLVIMALCKTASVADKRAENMYQTTHGGDVDGNN